MRGFVPFLTLCREKFAELTTVVSEHSTAMNESPNPVNAEVLEFIDAMKIDCASGNESAS